MPEKNQRRHRGFDSQSRRVYPYLLNYVSPEEARENIPALAKKLGVSGQAIGAYLGQAVRHEGVYTLLVEMGYADYQIPVWFRRPDPPVVKLVQQPETPPIVINEPRTTGAVLQAGRFPPGGIVIPWSHEHEPDPEPISSSATIHYLTGYEDPKKAMEELFGPSYSPPPTPTPEELRLKEEAMIKAKQQEEEYNQEESRKWMNFFAIKSWTDRLDRESRNRKIREDIDELTRIRKQNNSSPPLQEPAKPTVVTESKPVFTPTPIPQIDWEEVKEAKRKQKLEDIHALKDLSDYLSAPARESSARRKMMLGEMKKRNEELMRSMGLG